MACEVGQTCAASGQSSVCPLGATCYYGTQWYESCPIGTYGKFDMLEGDGASGASRACETCPAGYKCKTAGMVIPEPCGAGYYSADGETGDCTQCDVGHFCERPDTSDTMMTANECSAGYQCALGTNERPFNDHDDQWGITDMYSCPLGNWCENGVSTQCLAGTYNPLYGANEIADCFPTPAGYYTDSDGMSDYVDW